MTNKFYINFDGIFQYGTNQTGDGNFVGSTVLDQCENIKALEAAFSMAALDLWCQICT